MDNWRPYKTRVVMAVLSLWILLWAGLPVQAEPQEAVPVLKDFFQSLQTKHYADTWRLIDADSQEVLVSMLSKMVRDQMSAEELQKDPDVEAFIAKAFRQGDNPLVKAFWDGWTAKLDLERYSTADWQLRESDPDIIIGASGINEQVYCLDEQGDYRVDFFSTFIK